ncbi:hypothetical protein L6164_031964 [Bauhinia variegata]|uniref:Uncharacterized protein n=1 Tax=Bauhinia variegata TaxID=167791 RepID=A0ACB9KMF1_BAUVA|nr:hypothetical protein L6164_031964 [Bauhinia variegata]
MLVEKSSSFQRSRPNLGALMHSDPTSLYTGNLREGDDLSQHTLGNASAASPRYYGGADSTTSSNSASPYYMSPMNPPLSPYNKSPWILPSPLNFNPFHFQEESLPPNGLIGSVVREEGHIYSLAVSGEFLYTGSDSKNIRVWKNLKDYAGFKSGSGLVKAIVISGDIIFTGHQDGKIRVWKICPKSPGSHKRIGSLPTVKDYVKSSMNPKNYVQVRRHKNAVKIKHFDAISSLSLDQDQGLLYSGSWDKTLKVWRISDSTCLESIDAHDDAVNSVVAAFGCFVFTGSADGTVKMWKRVSESGKGKTKHVLEGVLLKQENAVTALAVNTSNTFFYCGSSDGLVNFWERDPKNSELTHGGVLRGHKLAVLCLAAAENLVFSGSADRNVCVFKRGESGSHTWLSVLTGHTGPVKCIAVEQEEGSAAAAAQDQQNHRRAKGNRRWIVYTGSLDKSVKVWRVSEHAPDLSMIEWMASNGHAPCDSPFGAASCSPSSNNIKTKQELSNNSKHRY